VNTSASLSVEMAEQRVLGWQTKLHRWAGEDEHKRFGDVFNFVCEPATLLVAWERVKRNRGSQTPGIDGETRRRIEQIGVERVLGDVRASLKDGSFAPQPVRERMIPKRSGELRSLGIPTVRDRIVQMALKLVLEPVYEADFCPTSHGFRPGRRTQDAIEQVRFFINPPRGYEWVIEGDVEDCFGSIHRGLLLAELRCRVTDKRVLGLIKRFLGAGILREHGSLAATPSGTPQGGILSPLLANVALSVLDRHFESAWRAHTWNQRARHRAKGHPSYRMVRYADDFVVLVRGTRAQAEALKEQTAKLMSERLRLTLSPEKDDTRAEVVKILGQRQQLDGINGTQPPGRGVDVMSAQALQRTSTGEGLLIHEDLPPVIFRQRRHYLDRDLTALKGPPLQVPTADARRGLANLSSLT